MEASSPLAALHRPLMPAPAWGGRNMLRSGPLSHYASHAGAFSLREQLHKTGADYNFQDVRGSSPAASLAADLSQNFRLDSDASPHFPTPRRTLFTANMMSGMETRHFVTTPPLPSSSPGPTTELMEVSPLPHKTPFCTNVEVTSPTPISTPTIDDDHDDDMMLDSPAPITRQASLEPSKSVVAERRIAAPRRPSLSRMKGLSTTAIPSRAPAESQLPGFRFGTECGLGLSHSSSNLSLGECFESTSPPREQTTNSSPPSHSVSSRPMPLFVGLAGSGSQRLGSPMHCHSRRQSNPFLRNRKQVRRSLSMFEHPADIVKPKPDEEEFNTSSLKSVMDIEEIHELVLPHFLPEDPTDTIPRISKETLVEVLNGKYAEQYDQKVVIDVRFEYEYIGGHIKGAVNHNDKELLASQLFEKPMPGKTLLIFHCEYSAHRAPLMARYIRSEDRTVNAEHYPRLTYPEVYILDGGYKCFFADHRARCSPPNYVKMSDEKHQRTCEREMGRLKARKGLGRAQTFAFGQRDSPAVDTPSAPVRPSSRLASLSSLGYALGQAMVPGERSPARRMASY